MAGPVWIVQAGCPGKRKGDRNDAGPTRDYTIRRKGD